MVLSYIKQILGNSKPIYRIKLILIDPEETCKIYIQLLK